MTKPYTRLDKNNAAVLLVDHQAGLQLLVRDIDPDKFKNNVLALADYPNLLGYVRDLYQQPGVAATVRLDHIMAHYYASHVTINPTRVVPLGPQVDYSAPRTRSLHVEAM